MNGIRAEAAFICCLFLLMSLGPASMSAQNSATTRLLQLLSTEDPDSALDEIFKAAIDSGPPAIPALQGFMNGSGTRDQKLFALVSIAYIGGSSAVPIIRQEYDQRIAPQEDFAKLLALVLGSVDSVESRRQLIEMLSPDQYEDETIELAAKSLTVLRAKEAIPVLRDLQRAPGTVDSDSIKFALDSIERGYWNVALTPSDEKGRAIAAMLRNGVPNLAQSDYVFDEDGFWAYGPLGWVRRPGKRAGVTDAPSVKVHIGTEGSRAFLLLDGIRCGRRCRSGYHIVLRREGADWKVQSVNLAWIT
jgi:hypothetical protein